MIISIHHSQPHHRDIATTISDIECTILSQDDETITVVIALYSIFDQTDDALNFSDDAFVVEKLNKRFSEWKSFHKIDGIIDDRRNTGPDE